MAGDGVANVSNVVDSFVAEHRIACRLFLDARVPSPQAHCLK